MTVAAKVPSIGYVEDGVSLNFPAPFRYLDATCLDVTRFLADGTSQDLALGPDFTATPGPTDAGGTVTLTLTVAGARLKITRATPRVQPIDYQTNDRFPAETHELGLDRDMMIEQEQDAGFTDLNDRALTVPPGETIEDLPPADERAQGVLGFDADGNPVILPSGELGSVAVTAQRREVIAVAGQTSFQTNAQYTVGYLGVFVNGVRLSSQEFIASDGSNVVLDEPCQAGDIVLLEGFLGSATADGADSVFFVQAGAGAIQRTAQDKMRERISAADFGVVGNGVVDDAPALQKAVAYLAASGGGELWLGRGDILLRAPVVIAHNSITLVGAGPQQGGTRIVNGMAAGTAISFGSTTVQYSSCGIRAVMFGQAADTPSTASTGLAVQNMLDFAIERVAVSSYPAKLTSGMAFTAQCVSLRARQIYVSSCLGVGVTLQDCIDAAVQQSRSDANTGDGWDILGCSGIYFDSVTAYGNGGWGIKIDKSAAAGLTSVDHFYAKCVGDTSGAGNWLINELVVGTFVQCWGSTQKSTSANTWASGFLIQGTKTEQLSFIGAVATYNNAHGMSLVQGNRIEIIGGIFGEVGAASGVPHPNGMSGAGSGLAVAAACNRVKVIGGDFSGNHDYGIQNACTTLTVDGATMTNNSLGPFGATSNPQWIRNSVGYNPTGMAVPTPAMPASGVDARNLTGVDCYVYLGSGTATSLKIDGWGIAAGVDRMVFLPAGSTINVTYTGGLGWKWQGI